MKLLALGPLPPPLGGTTVLFDDFRKRIVGLPLDIEVVDMNDRRAGGPLGRLGAAVAAWRSVLRHLPACDVVSLHASSKRFIWYGAVLRVISILSGKPVVLRAFGGSLDLVYQRSGWLMRQAFRLAFGNSLVLLETTHLGNFFRQLFPLARIDRLPNSRAIDLPSAGGAQRNGRFVFVGHVNDAKGVGTLIDMLKRHTDAGIHVDVIGPLTQGFAKERLAGVPGLNYIGVIAPEQVAKVLASYEALVLPSQYEGEGHPGVILEAYAQGTPVVSTHWRSIPEIVLERRTGLLVNPGDPDQLFNALSELRANARLLHRMRRNSLRYARCFDAQYWHLKKWQSWLAEGCPT